MLLLEFFYENNYIIPYINNKNCDVTNKMSTLTFWEMNLPKNYYEEFGIVNIFQFLIYFKQQLALTNLKQICISIKKQVITSWPRQICRGSIFSYVGHSFLIKWAYLILLYLIWTILSQPPALVSANQNVV